MATSYAQTIRIIRDRLQTYVDNNGDTENDAILDRVAAYESAIESLNSAMDELEGLA